MILEHFAKYYQCHGILHVCGDDPEQHQFQTSKLLVFSTYVEMILEVVKNTTSAFSILHVCGDDPKCFSWANDPIPCHTVCLRFMYSPRMWR